MENLVALAVATAVLVAIPGPNAALVVANSLRHGFPAGAMTVLGTTAGVAAQLLLVGLGMSAVLELAADTFTWIRWAGVAYLVYLGIRSWNQPPSDLADVTAARTAFWHGCGIAAINPKTLLFNAAFLPQFVPASGSATAGVVSVAAVFLFVLLAGDLLWAVFASSARGLLQKYSHWRNRLTGGFLVAAGIGLALARKSDL